MSDFLQHLVARFSGDAKPLSRPRLPSRFEPLVTGHMAPDSAPANAVFEHHAVREADLASQHFGLDSSSPGISEERLNADAGRPAATPLLSVEPHEHEQFRTEPAVRQTIHSEDSVGTTPATEPAVRESPPMARPPAALPPSHENQPPAAAAWTESGSTVIAEPDRTLLSSVETAQHQRSDESLKTPRGAAPTRSNQPAFPLPSRDRTVEPAAKESIVRSERHIPIGSVPMPQPEHLGAPPEPTAVLSAITQTPITPPGPSREFKPADDDHPVSEPLTGAVFSTVDPGTNSLLIPSMRTTAAAPVVESQLMERPQQEPSSVPAPASIVNVNIGRVEVTATSAPSAPRQSRKTEPATKLSEYLRRGGAGGDG